MNYVFVACALVGGASGCFANPAADRYLGKTPPEAERTVFLPAVTERIAISRDGHEIYFNGHNGSLAWYRFDGERWTGPRALFPDAAAAALSPDERTLYFQNAAGALFRSARTATGWAAPEPFAKAATGRLHYLQVTNDGGMFATAMAQPGVQGQIGRLEHSPTGDAVVSFGAPVNSADNGVDFFIARDGSYLVFVNHPGGNGDLNICFRQEDGGWSEPRNLGPTVNGANSWEWGPFVTSDNKYLFYTSGTSAGDSAVYWIRFDTLLAQLRPHPPGR